MNLQFDSVAELDEFLTYCRKLGAQVSVAGVVVERAPAPRFDAPLPKLDLADFEPAAEPTPEPEQTGEALFPAAQAAPKRKRRTKAEMEADAQRAEQPQPEQPANVPVPAPVAPEAQVPAGAQLAPVEAPAVPAAAEAPAVADAEPTEAAAWIAWRAKRLGDLTPIVHLTRCREFIGAKGMAAYNDTFKTAGLPSNVMGYTPEQCALHAAVLEWAAAH